MTTERARELIRLMQWENGGCLILGKDGKLTPRPDVPPETPEERAFVIALWERNPSGASSYATTLYAIASGEVSA